MKNPNKYFSNILILVFLLGVVTVYGQNNQEKKDLIGRSPADSTRISSFRDNHIGLTGQELADADFPKSWPLFGSKALRMARENNIPLMQLIAMTSYNTALPLGKMGLKDMQVRGRMQVGMVADITIFNPETVTDNSTYVKGTLPSTGIPYVIVNGVIVMKDSEPIKGVNPGQPIRFAVEEKGRFLTLSKDNWIKQFSTMPVDFSGTSQLNRNDFVDHNHK